MSGAETQSGTAESPGLCASKNKKPQYGFLAEEKKRRGGESHSDQLGGGGEKKGCAIFGWWSESPGGVSQRMIGTRTSSGGGGFSVGTQGYTAVLEKGINWRPRSKRLLSSRGRSSWEEAGDESTWNT